MDKSETIGKLAEALSKAQGAIVGAIRDKSNPYYKSSYADLASAWEACRKPLSDNGLAVMQIPCNEDPDVVTIETLLTHSSGEWIKSVIRMKPVKADPQGMGSCITYARRYSLMAMVGIAPEDDDGNAASRDPRKVPERAPQQEDPNVTKKYEMHPGEPKDVPEIKGEVSPDEATIIADLKNNINAKMLGFKKEQKREFYQFVMEGRKEEVDVLQGFIDNYMEYRTAYLRSKGE